MSMRRSMSCLSGLCAVCVLFVWSVCCVSCLSGLGVICLGCLCMFIVLITQYMMYIQRGESALMVAVRSGVTGVVKELMKRGADLNLQNKVCQ